MNVKVSVRWMCDLCKMAGQRLDIVKFPRIIAGERGGGVVQRSSLGFP